MDSSPFSANFDRRHNVNLLATYYFGNNNSWSASARWNLGTGFPFTQVTGFYGYYSFFNTTDFDYIEGNPDISPIFADQINEGRLPDYHRLDFSLQKQIRFSKHAGLKITAAVTNAYDRENIFYLDVLTLNRVNQLPIMPSLGLEVSVLIKDISVQNVLGKEIRIDRSWLPWVFNPMVLFI